MRHAVQEIRKWDVDIIRYYYSVGMHCRLIATIGQQRSHFYTLDEVVDKITNHPYVNYDDYIDLYCKLTSITSIT